MPRDVAFSHRPGMKFILRIGIIVLFVAGAFLFRDRISGGASDLQAGDCFDIPTTATDTVKDVQHHPCSESHTAEVIIVTAHPAAKGAPLPTDAAMASYLSETCGNALMAYVDTADAATYDLGAFYPLEKDWDKDERGVTCYLTKLDGSSMTASAKAKAS